MIAILYGGCVFIDEWRHAGNDIKFFTYVILVNALTNPLMVGIFVISGSQKRNRDFEE